MARFKVTRKQIMAARATDCSWTVDVLTANMEARFPGGKSIVLAELIDAWLADEGLSFGALGQASFLAGTLAPEVEQEEGQKRKRQARGSFTRPRECLEAIKAALPGEEG